MAEARLSSFTSTCQDELKLYFIRCCAYELLDSNTAIKISNATFFNNMVKSVLIL
jgi:hypothetical protein